MSSGQLRVHKTSGTSMPSLRYLSATSTSTVFPANGWAGTKVLELTDLGDSRFVLRASIPIRVSWSSDMSCYVAVDDVFQWHGQGDTPEEALADLVDVIVEDYCELSEWPGTLSPPLQKRLNTMKRYIGDAG